MCGSVSRVRSALIVVGALAVLAASCGRGGGLGIDEATEILVIDGVERRRAECIVDRLAGDVALPKITGLDTDLNDAELVALSEASESCAEVLVDIGGVTGGRAGEASAEDELWWEEEPDIESLVDDLVRGGVEPEAATCVGRAVEESPEPDLAAVDQRFLADALLVCRG